MFLWTFQLGPFQIKSKSVSFFNPHILKIFYNTSIKRLCSLLKVKMVRHCVFLKIFNCNNAQQIKLFVLCVMSIPITDYRKISLTCHLKVWIRMEASVFSLLIFLISHNTASYTTQYARFSFFRLIIGTIFKNNRTLANATSMNYLVKWRSTYSDLYILDTS